MHIQTHMHIHIHMRLHICIYVENCHLLYATRSIRKNRVPLSTHRSSLNFWRCKSVAVLFWSNSSKKPLSCLKYDKYVQIDLYISKIHLKTSQETYLQSNLKNVKQNHISHTSYKRPNTETWKETWFTFTAVRETYNTYLFKETYLLAYLKYVKRTWNLRQKRPIQKTWKETD